MTHSNGVWHTETAFYKSNTKESRRHFVEKLIAENEQALEKYKKGEGSLVLSEHTFKDRYEVLIKLKDEFIEKGTVRESTYVSLNVHEQKMIDL
ncbi:hypothetical protein [Acinetobacter baumannii]|uniref:hypothetical protein n=1 Tax=Acinetobacter baumannii TaxID=470 RepID=UPI00111337EE|nr:hypothetical protein [Acinetobacter baumannii]